ncbi:uncharacterized protein M421DRAFT_418077 [Didymella exigua CBS 183.55]|uniref:Uncharacterized protein n=1 Tax=Didymella exigua CBS 183.55 TaxID=1150837 RepID=A0A6A5RVU3_9PLEO|nr:uncharacterized protein M421DRAFT_418077 [Didymella exigua CBS 183.55]KAF1931440.1 hypothetical protein M421DRAFT_418077 [Didymella exigua CBS 183.55]
MIKITVENPNTGIPNHRTPSPMALLPTMSRPCHRDPPGPSPLRDMEMYSLDSGSESPSSEYSSPVVSRYGHRSVSEANGRGNARFRENLPPSRGSNDAIRPVDQAPTHNDEVSGEPMEMGYQRMPWGGVCFGTCGGTPCLPGVRANCQGRYFPPRLRRRLTKSHLRSDLNDYKGPHFVDIYVAREEARACVVEDSGSQTCWTSRKRRAKAWLIKLGWRSKSKKYANFLSVGNLVV